MRIELTANEVTRAVSEYALRQLGCVGKFKTSTSIVYEPTEKKLSATVTFDETEPVETTRRELLNEGSK